jgi:hypothetical protein
MNQYTKTLLQFSKASKTWLEKGGIFLYAKKINSIFEMMSSDTFWLKCS